MKTILMIIVLCAACQLAGAQTIRRVNNNFDATGLNIYSTVQAAHDAAAANDILIIEPSLVGYGDLTATKPLKIYGNGYFLTSNPELRMDTRTSTLGAVIFNTGSGGSYIAGVIIVSGASTRMVSNVTITRCYLNNLIIDTHNLANTSQANVSDITVSQNFFTGGVSGPNGVGYTTSNVSVTNNIIYTGISATGNDIQGWIVKNNSFLNTGNCCTNVPIALYNSVFDSNLLITPTNGGYNYSVSFTNTTASYNVSFSTNFTAVNGNQINVDVVGELVPSAGLSPDEIYQLKVGSPLKIAGSAGTEVGAFGGDTPYVISGIPPIPSVTNMVNTATGSNTVDLQVTISVKSNN